MDNITGETRSGARKVAADAGEGERGEEEDPARLGLREQERKILLVVSKEEPNAGFCTLG